MLKTTLRRINISFELCHVWVCRLCMKLGFHPAWHPVSCLFVPKIAVSAMVLADGRFGYGLSSVYRVTPAVCSAVEEWSKIAGCLSVLRWLSVCVCACVCVCGTFGPAGAAWSSVSHLPLVEPERQYPLWSAASRAGTRVSRGTPPEREAW